VAATPDGRVRIFWDEVTDGIRRIADVTAETGLTAGGRFTVWRSDDGGVTTLHMAGVKRD